MCSTVLQVIPVVGWPRCPATHSSLFVSEFFAVTRRIDQCVSPLMPHQIPVNITVKGDNMIVDARYLCWVVIVNGFKCKKLLMWICCWFRFMVLDFGKWWGSQGQTEPVSTENPLLHLDWSGRCHLANCFLAYIILYHIIFSYISIYIHTTIKHLPHMVTWCCPKASIFLL